MELTPLGHKELKALKDKVESRTATATEIEYFLDLLFGYDEEFINKFISAVGCSSIAEVKTELKFKKDNQDLVTALAVVGGVILIAWSLSQK